MFVTRSVIQLVDLVSVCIHEGGVFTYHCVHLENNLWVGVHLLPPCVSRGWSSSLPAWQQVPLAAELPHQLNGEMSLHETELLPGP